MQTSNPVWYNVQNCCLRLISSKYFLHPTRESKQLFLWLWWPSFTFAREMSGFTVQFKRRAVEASWQTHFVVFIYVKPVNCMRKLFPQRAPILLVGAPTTSEELSTNPDIPPKGEKKKKENEKKKKFGFQQKELLMEDVSLQDKKITCSLMLFNLFRFVVSIKSKCLISQISITGSTFRPFKYFLKI